MGILRTSPLRSSEKFPYSTFCEVDQLQRLQLPHNTRRYTLPVWVPGLSGWGYRGVLRPYIVGLLVCLPAKRPRESPPLPLWARTHEEEEHQNEPKRLWAGGVALIVVVVVGAAALLTTVGAGYAKDEDASRAKCSNATLEGTYLFAADGVEIKGNEQLPFANAGYDVFDGNGKVKD